MPLSFLSGLGITFAQKCTDSKSNEIPAVQELLAELGISGCLVVADALNCQKKTAAGVTVGKGDYLLCTKDNQETLKNDIEEYVQDEILRESMEKAATQEKNRGRIEKRTAFTTSDVSWLAGRENGKG